MSRQHAHAKAFTIFEMLVVVGVLALMLGMLLPALSGAMKRSSKTKELNAIRQVGLGWTLYSNSNNDKLLPGYLDFDVQQRWRVRYEYPNHWDIPTGELAGPWTWRLLPYLESSIPTVLGNADEVFTDSLDDTDLRPDKLVVYETLTLDPSMTGADSTEMGLEADPIAREPRFGYNAYYVGGWWTMVIDPRTPGNGLPRPLFYDAAIAGTSQPVNVVSRSVGTIRRPTTLMIFCAASRLEPGLYRKFPSNQAGSHYVVPPRLGTVAQWNSGGTESASAIGASALFDGAAPELTTGGSDPTTLLVHVQDEEGGVAAPIGRYNRLAAMLHADGHTAVGTPGSLTDMRMWIDTADQANFAHDGWPVPR